MLHKCLIDRISNKDGKNEPGDGGCLDNDKLPSDTVKASATSDPKALSSNARSRADMQKPVLNVSSAPFDWYPPCSILMCLFVL